MAAEGTPPPGRAGVRRHPSVMDWEREFAQGYARSWTFYRPYVSLCLKYGPPGSWLDLGCGPGYFVECCERYGIACQGLEGDPHAVRGAATRYPGLRVREHDITTRLPFDDGSFTVVFCNQVIEHLPRSETVAVLSEARRLLSAGGLLFVGSPSRFNRAQFKPEHINLLAPSELNSSLLDAGFQEVWPANYPLFFLGRSTAGRALAGALYLLLPLDRLASTATALAFAGDAGRGVVRSARHFHFKRLLAW